MEYCNAQRDEAWRNGVNVIEWAMSLSERESMSNSVVGVVCRLPHGICHCTMISHSYQPRTSR